MNDSKYKEKLEQLKDNPGILFGLLYPYIIVIILGVGLYYLPHIGEITRQQLPPVISESPVVVDLAVQKPRTIPPVDVFEISKPTPELIAKGEALYKTTCASCHGEEGAGAGPASVGLNPAPRNFTKKEGWTNGETISGIYMSLQDGIANSGMIAYDFLTPEEKFGLAHYIRSKFITDPPVDDEMELFGLDILYDLSAGLNIPGQMPTEFAMQLIAEKHEYKFDKIYAAIEDINTDKDSKTSQLLKSITDDLQLALSALENSDIWRGSQDSFVRFLTTNVNQNGFNGKIFNLNNEEWDTLYNYLISAL